MSEASAREESGIGINEEESRNPSALVHGGKSLEAVLSVSSQGLTG